MWIGGLLCLAVMVEYLAAPMAAAIVMLAVKQRGWASLKGITTGALPFIALLMTYHWAALGSFWATPYSRPPNMFATDGAAFSLFVKPSWHVFWSTTFGQYRGLFFGSPVLLLACFGLVSAYKKGGIWRNGALASGFVVVLHFIFLWTFNGWHGGAACGARYFIPAILFLMWPIALIWNRARAFIIAAGLMSIFMMLAATAVTPQIPSGNPAEGEPKIWVYYLLPAFFSGDLAENVQSVDEKYPAYQFWPRGRAFWVFESQMAFDRSKSPAEELDWTVRSKAIQDKLNEISMKYPADIYNPRHPWVAGATNCGLLMGLPGLFSLIPLALIWSFLGSLLYVKCRRINALHRRQ